MNEPPQLRTLRSLMLGAFTGMKITPLTFMKLQEYATPCAWLPALAQTTPLAFSSSVNVVNLLYAPRNLNERTI